jgi:hypothetical protein
MPSSSLQQDQPIDNNSGEANEMVKSSSPMANGMAPVVRPGAVRCVWVAAMLMISTGASSQDYKGLRQTDFPALVSAVEFSTGAKMTVSSYVSWGRWKFMLQPKTVATWLPFAPPDHLTAHRISIEPVTCSNEIAGEQQCNLTLQRDGGRWDCIFFNAGQTPSHVFRPFEIQCPVGLLLK